jgi:hypothetical protein
MAQISVEIICLPGSLLRGNLHNAVIFSLCELQLFPQHLACNSAAADNPNRNAEPNEFIVNGQFSCQAIDGRDHDGCPLPRGFAQYLPKHVSFMPSAAAASNLIEDDGHHAEAFGLLIDGFKLTGEALVLVSLLVGRHTCQSVDVFG